MRYVCHGTDNISIERRRGQFWNFSSVYISDVLNNPLIIQPLLSLSWPQHVSRKKTA
jgi:hypothetical protein